ncbi:hypothetical protein CGRA01v4_14882 [Colletotrichum graminicola]|nr:hypothetical protein CGRA01v4_14882 [Colletotrichum graminicola]
MSVDENQVPATVPHSEADSGKMPLSQTPSPSSSTDIMVVNYDGISTPVGYPKNVSVAPSSSFNHAGIIPKNTGDVVATAPSSEKDSLPPSLAGSPLSSIPTPKHSNIRGVYKDEHELDPVLYNGYSITSKKGINKEKADMPLLNRESRRYIPGRNLTLFPIVPAPPHGLPGLPSLEQKLPKGQIRNFESTSMFSLRDVAKVEILELIKGGIGLGIQLVLCKVFESKDLHDVRKRYVGAVLMEYIEGASMESMCNREIVYDDDYYDDDDGRVFMVPKNAFLSPPSSQDGKSGNNGDDLEEPRVVFLDYSYSVVWSDTITSKEGRADDDCLDPLILHGSTPPATSPSSPAGFRLSGRNARLLFEDWLEKEFGELVEGKYSTCETLVRVLEQASEAAKRRYLADYPGKADADLEMGDRTLMLYPEREEQRLREGAMYKETTDNFHEAMRRIKQFEEEEKSRVDQPEDVDEES